MLERDEILELVKKGLTEVGQELLLNSRFSNKDWTIGIISKLGGFALESGYTVYPELTEGGEVRKSSEWLCDLTWCIEDKERGWAFRGIGLALESEWKSDLWNLNYDFQKLVQAKTEVKVFVCNDLSDRNLEVLRTGDSCRGVPNLAPLAFVLVRAFQSLLTGSVRGVF